METFPKFPSVLRVAGIDRLDRNPPVTATRCDLLTLGAFHYAKDSRKLKWKGSFRFLLTGIFGITSGGGPHISVGIFPPKFVVPFLTNRFFALIKEFGNKI